MMWEAKQHIKKHRDRESQNHISFQLNFKKKLWRLQVFANVT